MSESCILRMNLKPSAQLQVRLLRRLEVVVWRFFDYDTSTNKCTCKVETVSGMCSKEPGPSRRLCGHVLTGKYPTTGPAALVRPVRPWPYRFSREKNGVAWILTYACIIEWPLRVVRRSLGRIRGLLRTFSSLQASKVSTRELRLLNFLWRYLSARRVRKLGRG